MLNLSDVPETILSSPKSSSEFPSSTHYWAEPSGLPEQENQEQPEQQYPRESRDESTSDRQVISPPLLSITSDPPVASATPVREEASCATCSLRLTGPVAIERHRLSHGLVTKLSHNLQLTLTSATPSPAIEWFVGKVQFDFNDHRWGRAAVQQVDDLLALCTADDLAYLGKDVDFQDMVRVLQLNHQQERLQEQPLLRFEQVLNSTLEATLAAPPPSLPLMVSGSPNILETGLVRPIVFQILSKEILPGAGASEARKAWKRGVKETATRSDGTSPCPDNSQNPINGSSGNINNGHCSLHGNRNHATKYMCSDSEVESTPVLPPCSTLLSQRKRRLSAVEPTLMMSDTSAAKHGRWLAD